MRDRDRDCDAYINFETSAYIDTSAKQQLHTKQEKNKTKCIFCFSAHLWDDLALHGPEGRNAGLKRFEALQQAC
jgi:hypothetical protein